MPVSLDLLNGFKKILLLQPPATGGFAPNTLDPSPARFSNQRRPPLLRNGNIAPVQTRNAPIPAFDARPRHYDFKEATASDLDVASQICGGLHDTVLHNFRRQMCQENDLESILGLLLEIVDDNLTRIMSPGERDMKSPSFVMAEVHWCHGLVTNKKVLKGPIAVVKAGLGKALRGRQGLNEAIDLKGAQRRNGDIVVEAGGSVDRGNNKRGRGRRMNKEKE
ncbi:MAG: hypothetical protein Q9208_000229 [Pyrenodesmia sp. 3 TL-2023]